MFVTKSREELFISALKQMIASMANEKFQFCILARRKLFVKVREKSSKTFKHLLCANFFPFFFSFFLYLINFTFVLCVYKELIKYVHYEYIYMCDFVEVMDTKWTTIYKFQISPFW